MQQAGAAHGTAGEADIGSLARCTDDHREI